MNLKMWPLWKITECDVVLREPKLRLRKQHLSSRVVLYGRPLEDWSLSRKACVAQSLSVKQFGVERGCANQPNFVMLIESSSMTVMHRVDRKMRRL